MPSPTKAPPKGHSVDTGADPKPLSPDASETDWSPSKLKILKTKLPSYTPSEILIPLAILSGTHIAHMTLCIDKDVAATVKSMSADLLANDWSKIEFPTLQHNGKGNDKRKIFNAEIAPFRINAVLSRGNEKGCTREQTRTKAYLSFSLPSKPTSKPDLPSRTAVGTPPTMLLPKEIPAPRTRRGPSQKEKPGDGGTTGRVPPRTK